MTRRRVLLDTTPRRMGRWLALALALHAPLTPLAGFLGLIRLLDDSEDVPTSPPVTEIPLDLIDDEASPPGPEATSPPPPEPAAAPEPPPVKEPDAPAVKKPPEPVDAGAPDAADAGVPDAGKTSDAGADPDAGAADAGTERKPGEGIGSPVAGIGNKRVVDPNAYVQLLVHNDRVRQHPLGASIGPLLRNVYQWRDFFGPTGIDPIKDIDRMLIVGSQLRDSRDVVAILQFNIPQQTVHDAVDLLVKRDPEGSWSDAGVPVAKAHADRGERAFVFPSPQVLVVTPPATEAAAKRLGNKFRLVPPKSDEIALAKLATPWRAFRGSGLSIPQTISSAEIRLSPLPEGGVVIDLLAHSESDEQAQADAKSIKSAIDNALGNPLLWAMTGGKKLINKMSFEGDGSKIRGEIVLTRNQVEMVLALAQFLMPSSAPRPRPVTSAPPPTAPVVPTPTVSP
jgi:hypothetical protein